MQVLFNQLVYFAFFQSILLLFVYLFSKKSRKQINGYLAFLVFILFIGLSGRVLFISEIFGQDFRLILFSEFAALLFGTTVYLFTQTSLLGKEPSRKDWIHYVPALGYSIFIVFYFMLPSDEIISSRIKTGELQRVIYLFHAIGLIVNCTYWGLSFRAFLSFRKNLENELSYTVKTNFFYNFHLVIGLALLTWVVLFLFSISGFDMLERNARSAIWLSLAFVILFIAYYGMIAPEVYRIKPLEELRKYTQSKYSKDELDQLKLALETLMEEKKPYLNSKLLKAELASLLDISNPEMSRLLNERIGMNFFDYVNYYRIKEFIDLAKTEKANQLTIFGLAQEAGFNSKTTFNKSFKKLMGVSPTSYFNSQNN